MKRLFSLIISTIAFIFLLALPAYAASTQLTWLTNAPVDTAAFRKVTAPQTWHFPEDFGPHPDYQTEWWYYTGNLETLEGRSFGFQLTFFRQAISSPVKAKEAANQTPTQSDWRGNQIYSAHFTISDVAPQTFYAYDRFSRDRIQLAGAAADPYHVWLENWSATEVEPGKVRLQAETPEVALNLMVEQRLPPILHGDRGLSIKGRETGNASYYYSLVQQPTTGSIKVKGQTFTVKGLTWKDHEYSTNTLSAGTVGWDWFSIQFDNGTALMMYLLRHEDGTLEPTSAGTFIAADGTTTALTSQDWRVETLNTWKSTKSKAVYPAKWTIEIPKLNLTLRGQPLMPNQELTTQTATYWEGAVAFQGVQQDQPLQGKGYVELTGYADRLDSLLSVRE